MKFHLADIRRHAQLGYASILQTAGVSSENLRWREDSFKSTWHSINIKNLKFYF